MLNTLRRDIQSVFDRDPAARSLPEVLLCYPGLYAVWGYRLSHWLWTHHLKLPGRYVSQIMRFFTGIEIHPGAKIGRGLFIDHGMGVVIGETAELGEEVTLYHTVTLGGTNLQKGKRHPTIGDRVTIGAGAKVLGPIEIGCDSRIGANAVVVKAVPPDVVVVGVPGEVVQRSHPRAEHAPDLDHSQLPDVLGETIVALMRRVDDLEKKLQSPPQTDKAAPHAPEKGIWNGTDFSI